MGYILKTTLYMSLYNEFGEDEGGLSREFLTVPDAIKAMDTLRISGGAGCSCVCTYKIECEEFGVLAQGTWDELRYFSKGDRQCYVIVGISDKDCYRVGSWQDDERAYEHLLLDLTDKDRWSRSGYEYKIMTYEDFTALSRTFCDAKKECFWNITDSEGDDSWSVGLLKGTELEAFDFCKKHGFLFEKVDFIDPNNFSYQTYYDELYN